MSDSDRNPTPNADSEDATSASEASEHAQGEAVAAPDPIEQLTAERDKLKDQLLRTMADFDNFRKRARRDAEDALRLLRDDFLRLKRKNAGTETDPGVLEEWRRGDQTSTVTVT